LTPTARWITQGDPLHQRLQPFRYLHDCSDHFRLEHLPGGIRTHWKAPPFHGAHPKQTFAGSNRVFGTIPLEATDFRAMPIAGEREPVLRPLSA
jgi:hypothetical protein